MITSVELAAKHTKEASWWLMLRVVFFGSLHHTEYKGKVAVLKEWRNRYYLLEILEHE